MVATVTDESAEEIAGVENPVREIENPGLLMTLAESQTLRNVVTLLLLPPLRPSGSPSTCSLVVNAGPRNRANLTLANIAGNIVIVIDAAQSDRGRRDAAEPGPPRHRRNRFHASCHHLSLRKLPSNNNIQFHFQIFFGAISNNNVLQNYFHFQFHFRIQY